MVYPVVPRIENDPDSGVECDDGAGMEMRPAVVEFAVCGADPPRVRRRRSCV
jgi:hypothetical protein